MLKTITKKVALFLVKFYQVCISPLFGPCCRYTPTCSEYARIAIERFGAVKGTRLAFKRLMRCRPGQDYGYDPVPKTFN